MMIRRKFIWLMILMVWVGMVTSIIVYQGGEFLPASGNVEISEEDQEPETGDSNDYENINYTLSEEDEETETEEDFFIEYRIERDKARSEQISLYREMINNPNTDEAMKEKSQEKMLALTDKMEKEMEIESLIRARGFKDALAYIHDSSVDVIIQSDEQLNKEEVARVGDIIVKTTGFDFDDVTIIEKKTENK